MLIQRGGDGNDLVETNRGKYFRNLDLPIDFLTDNDETTTANAADAAITPVNNYLDLEMDDDDSEDENGLMSTYDLRYDIILLSIYIEQIIFLFFCKGG